MCVSVLFFLNLPVDYMQITFLTIFPESFSSFLNYTVIKRAQKKGLVAFDVVDIRKYADGCFRKVDDSPYGGGSGLLLRVDTLANALNAVKTVGAKTILMGPKGKKFSQAIAHDLAKEEHIILIAGHYEGVDERFRSYVDYELSIGDYILTGGESAAMITAEAVTRLLEGALRGTSAKEESFENGILEYPQYTHPAIFKEKGVPSVLLSGDREKIRCFNEIESVKETIRLRPDMLREDREFTYCSLHKDYGNEAKIIRWLSQSFPVPEILYEDESYLLLSKKKGRVLSASTRNRILKTSVMLLKAFWAMDISSCPCFEDIKLTIENLKKKHLSYKGWMMLQDVEKTQIKEDFVFSHGNLTLDNIIVNGNGIVMLKGMQKAGRADRYRDIVSLMPSLEEIGIKKEEFFALLGIKPDEDKISLFQSLRILESEQC